MPTALTEYKLLPHIPCITLNFILTQTWVLSRGMKNTRIKPFIATKAWCTLNQYNPAVEPKLWKIGSAGSLPVYPCATWSLEPWHAGVAGCSLTPVQPWTGMSLEVVLCVRGKGGEGGGGGGCWKVEDRYLRCIENVFTQYHMVFQPKIIPGPAHSGGAKLLGGMPRRG